METQNSIRKVWNCWTCVRSITLHTTFYLRMFMLKNIILKIIADKKARKIEPTHALFKDVFDRATIEGIAADEIRKGLNELFINGEIEVGRTINDKYITIK